MTYWAIDHIDGAWAYLVGDDGGVLVPRDWLPGTAREGDVLRLERPVAVEENADGDATLLRFALDRGETRRRLEANRALHASLPRAPAGDVEL